MSIEKIVSYMNYKVHKETWGVSVQFVVQIKNAADLNRLLKKLTRGMRAINKWAKENNGEILYVRGYKPCCEETLITSEAKDDVKVKGSQTEHQPSEIRIRMAAIVFGIKIGEFEKQFDGLISQLLINFDLKYIAMHEW